MNIFFALTIACYIASSLGYQAYVVFQKRAIYRIAMIGLWTGFVCHTIVIAMNYVEAGYVPVQNIHETFSAFAWAVAGVFLALQIRFNLMVLGALVAPVAALCTVIASILSKPQIQVTPLFENLWRTSHIGAIILGNAAFAIAFLVSILYLIQERAIKSKKRGFFFRRLPSLKLLDSMGYSCLIVGFPVLTFGVIAGAVYSQMVRGRVWSWDPRVIFGVIAWLVYAVLLHERLAVGWQGRRAAIMTMAGFAVLLFTFFLRFLG